MLKKVAEIMIIAAVTCAAAQANAAKQRTEGSETRAARIAQTDRPCFAKRFGARRSATVPTGRIKTTAASSGVVRLPKRTRQWRSCP